MKVLFLLGFVALASARSIEYSAGFKTPSIIGYMTEYAIPLANEIRKAEEAAFVESRVTGGSFALLGQFPHQAGLLAQFSGGQGVCGGSLITNNRLVTAAHCWYDGLNRATSFTVVLGSITLFSGGTRQTTDRVVMHPQWTPSLIRNDVAVIHLLSNVGSSDYINPIALPSGSEVNNNFVGFTANVTGFGRTADDMSGNITPGQQLSYAIYMPILTNAECSESYENIVASNICASGANGRSTCSGDSGGPLTVNSAGRPILVGIKSFGSASGCEQGYPPVFSRSTSFISWINSVL